MSNRVQIRSKTKVVTVPDPNQPPAWILDAICAGDGLGLGPRLRLRLYCPLIHHTHTLIHRTHTHTLIHRTHTHTHTHTHTYTAHTHTHTHTHTHSYTAHTHTHSYTAHTHTHTHTHTPGRGAGAGQTDPRPENRQHEGDTGRQPRRLYTSSLQQKLPIELHSVLEYFFSKKYEPNRKWRNDSTSSGTSEYIVQHLRARSVTNFHKPYNIPVSNNCNVITAFETP